LPVIDIAGGDSYVNYGIDFSNANALSFDERGSLAEDIAAFTNTVYNLPAIDEPLRLITD